MLFRAANDTDTCFVASRVPFDAKCSTALELLAPTENSESEEESRVLQFAAPLLGEIGCVDDTMCLTAIRPLAGGARKTMKVAMKVGDFTAASSRPPLVDPMAAEQHTF